MADTKSDSGAPDDRLEFRALDETGTGRLIDMAAAEGWNPGLHDAETFYRTDPEAFLGLYDDDRFIGGGAIARHSEGFGFMGLFIVEPDYRGRGLGRKLWIERRNRLLERLAADAAIGMDGVTAMVPFYEAGGFKPHYLSARYETSAPEIEPLSKAHIHPLSEFDAPVIEELDRRAFPGPRKKYLTEWLAQPDAISLGFGTRPSQLQGFGVLRPCRIGHKIGPLFATSPSVANELVLSLCFQVPGQSVSIDVPTINKEGLLAAEGIGMKKVFECTRMYYGQPPSHDPSLVFGLTSFELG